MTTSTDKALTRLSRLEQAEREQHAGLTEQADHLHHVGGVEMGRAARLLGDAKDDASAPLEDVYGRAGAARGLAATLSGVLEKTGSHLTPAE